MRISPARSSMPSNVTLLVDPGVYVYFSRNAQDYDKVAGTHTCGTVEQRQRDRFLPCR